MYIGRPAHSLYFVGVQDQNLFYLDPHTVQEAASDETCLASDFPKAEEIEKYHCSSVKHILTNNIDPSLAIGFYCRTVKDFVDLRARIGKSSSAQQFVRHNCVALLGQLNRVGPAFISVRETRPVYKGLYSDSSCDDEEGLETASEGNTNDDKYESKETVDETENDEFVLL